jgi:hypothetical protein
MKHVLIGFLDFSIPKRGIGWAVLIDLGIAQRGLLPLRIIAIFGTCCLCARTWGEHAEWDGSTSPVATVAHSLRWIVE